MSDKKSNVPERTRNFATVIYQESALENWVDILTDLKIPCFISPLHDQDTWTKEDEKKNPEHKAGTKKKAHWHVQFIFDGVKNVNQVQEVIDQIGGVGCEVLKSLRGMARYLCHLDNPDKHRYNISDVKALGGADYAAVINTMSDKVRNIKEMNEYIKKNDVRYYCDFMDVCAEEYPEWFDCLINGGSYTIKEYIKSYAYKQREIEFAAQTEKNLEDVRKANEESIAKHKKHLEEMKERLKK